MILKKIRFLNGDLCYKIVVMKNKDFIYEIELLEKVN